MKNFSALLLALIALLFFTQCSDDESDTDLTVNVVGVFHETGGDAIITVNKMNNTTVTITVEDYYDFAFTDVTMNSATAFTLNTYSRNNEGCEGTQTISGTGTASNNNISLFITIDGESTAPFNACYDDTYNVSGSK